MNARYPVLFCFLWVAPVHGDVLVTANFEKDSCHIIWAVENPSHETLTLPRNELPWEDGIMAAKLNIYADDKAIPQRHFSFSRELGLAEIPPRSRLTKHISASEALSNWVLPKKNLDVVWVHKLYLGKKVYKFGGKFSIPKSCLEDKGNTPQRQ